ncbi:18643_t:CDS:2 [Funneliformis geosporum]|uniref:15792_t:CDS:1 n=1 Tax=Funneliformis geosporum TaxID=1117311 RepID=A0A9W4SQ09_9GLOM|nr:18643_t:CDS:2 [Funneliformis geosporum]CAI2176300.1 15792_t:CDS:2 [Funneliformis geosporum]
MLTTTLYYKDSMLTPADYSNLYDDNWLNDRCIDFYLEHLESNLPIKEGSVIKPYLLRASMSFLVTNIEDTTYLSKALPNHIFSSDIIFIPVNNKQNLESFVGGSHWSLLVYVKANNKFLYYDSADNYNIRFAYKYSDKISKVLGIEGNVEIMGTPQQINGSDCGVYLLSIIGQLYQRIIESSSYSNQVAFEEILKVDTQHVLPPSEMRQKIRELVKQLKNSK